MTFEWSNYGVIAEPINPDIKLITPPYTDNGVKALWSKPGMLFSVSQSSRNKEEAAKFINWFINDIEANRIIGVERGIPVSLVIRDSLISNLSEKQQGMYAHAELAMGHSTTGPPPEPQGIGEVNRILVDTIDKVLYGLLTPEDAAETFRREVNAILARNVG